MISAWKNFSETKWINTILIGTEAPRYPFQLPHIVKLRSPYRIFFIDQNSAANLCTSAYFGLLEKYQNIVEGSCSLKKCTACEIKNSLLETSTLTLRGLCRYSSFDRTYTVQYSSDSMVFYVGLERTIISYNFTLNIWTMRDVTNPAVTAVSEASFRSLAIGNIKWTISNDIKCRRGLNKTALI